MGGDRRWWGGEGRLVDKCEVLTKPFRHPLPQYKTEKETAGDNERLKEREKERKLAKLKSLGLCKLQLTFFVKKGLVDFDESPLLRSSI